MKKQYTSERIEALEKRVKKLEEELLHVAKLAARGAHAETQLRHQGNASGFPNVFANWF